MEISEYTEAILKEFDNMMKRLRVHGRQILQLKPEDRLIYVDQIQKFENTWSHCDTKAKNLLSTILQQIMVDNGDGNTTTTGNVG
jgi:hypothetical protein